MYIKKLLPVVTVMLFKYYDFFYLFALVVFKKLVVMLLKTVQHLTRKSMFLMLCHFSLG